jgi:probable F420-dependent oxidoreductase
VVRPFRFLASIPRLDETPSRWREKVRRIEDLGFSAVAISDHFTKGWVMEPTIAMMAAAESTEHLRVISLVLSNDYRHPVLLHKALATIDVLSDGRLEIGLGAGWMLSDYKASGIDFCSAEARIARLKESVYILKGLFGPSAFSFDGHHYHIEGLDGLPKPVQQPHPPLLLGGGGRRVLSLAAREADVVSVNANLREGSLTPSAGEDLSAARIAEKVRWIQEAAAAAGRSMDSIELQLNLYVCDITDSPSTARTAVSSFAATLQADPSLLDGSPAVLAGSLEQCVEALQERRERYGFSCFNLGGDIEATAAIVARLAGT